MRLTVEEHVFVLETYLKSMSYVHSRQSFVEKFGRQAPVKSAIAKMIRKERGENEWTSFPTPTVNSGYLCNITCCK
jgi:hypothetical protein